MGSRYQEAFGLLVPALQRPDARSDPALYAAALVTAAWVAGVIDLATARQLGEQAVQTARDLGDDRLLIRSLAVLCGAYYFAGELEKGIPFGQESVQRARQLGDDVLLAESLMGYLLPSQLSSGLIDPARAEQLMTEAIACTERSGDQLANSVLHDNAGWAALSTGDVPAARAHLEAAAHAAQAIGVENTTATVNMGMVLRAEGDPDGARSIVEAALRISCRTGDNLNMACACLYLACLAGDLGDWSRAAVLHGAAQAFQDRTTNPWQELDARYRQDSLAQARARLGDEQLDWTYAKGMALSLDQALDLAFGRAGSA